MPRAIVAAWVRENENKERPELKPIKRLVPDTAPQPRARAPTFGRRRWFTAAVALLTIASGLQLNAVGRAAVASERPFGLVLVTESAAPGETATVRGVGLEALRGKYSVTLGSEPVPQKLIRRWDDREIQFAIQVDPGRYQVALLASSGLGTIPVGSLDVEKAIFRPGVEILTPGRIEVRLASGAAPEEVVQEGDGFVRMFPSEPAGSKLGRWYSVAVPPESEIVRMEAYVADARVEVVQAGPQPMTIQRQPNDPCYFGTFTPCGTDNWNVRQTRLTAAWEVQTEGAAIAILDDGLPATHEDLGPINPRRDLTGGNNVGPCTAAGGGHGLGVASTAAARANNGRGLAGAVWGAQVGSFKVFTQVTNQGTATCAGNTEWLRNGLTAARDAGFLVVNFSGGTAGFDQALLDVVNTLWQQNVNIIAGAGNGDLNGNGGDFAVFPAAFGNAIGVAATTDTFDNRAGFSNWGQSVDIAAPGVGIPGANLNGTYGSWQGTSMAAPLVSGVMSLLRAQGLNQVGARDRLLGTADPVAWGGAGAGRVNAYRAVVPGQHCIRDVPSGAWVRRSNGAIYQVVAGGVARHAPDWSTYSSWIGADSDVVTLCEERFAELTVGSPLGFRPGSLIRDAGTGEIWLITTDGTDRQLPIKRKLGNWQTVSCFGWAPLYRDGSVATLGLHPTGPVIDNCNALLRVFPNGSVIRDSAGRIYVVEGGTKRPVASWGAFRSWFSDGEWVTVSDAEAAALGAGSDWSYRGGRQVHTSGESSIRIVSDDGAVRARGSMRTFEDAAAWVERGFNSRQVDTVPIEVAVLHVNGNDVRNANWMS